jgi:Acetyltransferase (GNAT) domain
MVIVETARRPFRVTDIFYPRPAEVDGLGDNLDLNQIVHIRQAPVELPARRFAIRYQTFETLMLDLTRAIEELFSHANQTGRYLVRKAERVRDRIEVRRNDEIAYKDFVIIYNDFVKAKKHTEQISERRLGALKPLSDTLVTYFEGRPVCGHLMIRDEKLKRVGLLWSASTRLKGEDAPALVASLNRWLHWHEMRLYQSEGFEVYDFGGIGDQTPEIAAITRFKLSFGGKRVVEHDYMLARAPGRVAVSVLYTLRRFRKMIGNKPAAGDNGQGERAVSASAASENGQCPREVMTARSR